MCARLSSAPPEIFEAAGRTCLDDADYRLICWLTGWLADY
eukprot:COSAG06_NODE_54162_length_296_cov_0.736041_1_plen_39_part_10